MGKYRLIRSYGMLLPVESNKALTGRCFSCHALPYPCRPSFHYAKPKDVYSLGSKLLNNNSGLLMWSYSTGSNPLEVGIYTYGFRLDSSLVSPALFGRRLLFFSFIVFRWH